MVSAHHQHLHARAGRAARAVFRHAHRPSSPATWWRRAVSGSVGWTLGLLHDIGSLVRLAVDRDTEVQIAAYCEAEEALPEEAESALGATASTVWGRELCEEWRLPSAFHLVASHHRSGVAPRTSAVDDAAYLAIVSASSLIARLVGSPLRPEVREAASIRAAVLLDCEERDLWDLLANAHALRAEADRGVNELLRGVA
ncbi:MAG: HDOD domain-containing protein [Myxococcota bacterium]